MEYTSVIISILALALSVFTFYWLNIREKRNFYLLRIDQMGTFQPEFALVNGGSKHVLVTTISCGFEHADTTSVSYPEQIIEHGKDESFLIQSGSAIHCKVRFPKPFTSSFVQTGVLREDETPATYMFKFRINISWVDSHGDNFEASAHVNDFGFHADGKLFLFSPVQKKHDLQTAQTRHSIRTENTSVQNFISALRGKCRIAASYLKR